MGGGEGGKGGAWGGGEGGESGGGGGLGGGLGRGDDGGGGDGGGGSGDEGGGGGGGGGICCTGVGGGSLALFSHRLIGNSLVIAPLDVPCCTQAFSPQLHMMSGSLRKMTTRHPTSSQCQSKLMSAQQLM